MRTRRRPAAPGRATAKAPASRRPLASRAARCPCSGLPGSVLADGWLSTGRRRCSPWLIAPGAARKHSCRRVSPGASTGTPRTFPTFSTAPSTGKRPFHSCACRFWAHVGALSRAHSPRIHCPAGLTALHHRSPAPLPLRHFSFISPNHFVRTIHQPAALTHFMIMKRGLQPVRHLSPALTLMIHGDHSLTCEGRVDENLTSPGGALSGSGRSRF
jgi:hypothetical protein